VRLNTATIPTPVQETSLKNWLLVVMTIPFIRLYSDKYSTTLNNINHIYKVRNQLVNHPETVNNIISTIAFPWIRDNVITEVYNKEHALQVFIRTFIQIALLASIEIIKKYNPCIVDTNCYNTNYDGSWLVPVDPQHIEHMNKLHSYFNLVKTEKMTNSSNN
jgi:hypothetical protein